MKFMTSAEKILLVDKHINELRGLIALQGLEALRVGQGKSTNTDVLKLLDKVIELEFTNIRLLVLKGIYV